MRVLFSIIVLMLLSACGFALRGSEQARLPFALSLNLQQENAPFSRNLRSALQSAGVEIVDSAAYRLSVGEEQHDIRPISVTGRASAAQYELRSTVRVSIANPEGETIFGPESIAVEKTYFEDVANIAGSNMEIELLRTEMRQELVDQLVRRLQAVPAPLPEP